MEKNYLIFFEFIKFKINPNFLKPIDTKTDIEEDRLLIFKSEKYKNVFLSNLDEDEILTYLSEINIGYLSFYYGGDYTLDRIYKKLNDSERKYFLKIVENLSNYELAIKKELDNIIKNEYNYNDQIKNIINKFFIEKKFEIKDLCVLLDAFLYCNSFRSNVIKYLKENIKEELVDYILKLDDIVIIENIMRINPKVKIYDQESKEIFLNFINEIEENSIYIKNLKYVLNKRNKNLSNLSNKNYFRINYTIKPPTSNPEKSDFDILLQEINNLIKNKNQSKFKFSFVQFKYHCVYLFLYINQLLVLNNTSSKIKQHYENTTKNLNNDIFAKIYADSMEIIIYNKPEKIDNLIDYVLEVKDEILKKEKLIEGYDKITSYLVKKLPDIERYLDKDKIQNMVTLDFSVESRDRIKKVFSWLIKIVSFLDKNGKVIKKKIK